MYVLQHIACSIAAGIDESCGDRESVAGHLLLFISALIPKAVASLLTSAVIELSMPENVWCRLYCTVGNVCIFRISTLYTNCEDLNNCKFCVNLDRKMFS